MIRDPDREHALAAQLAEELGDAQVAAQFARIVLDDILTWRAPVADPGAFDTILAFTFGNRMAANGNRSPGPVNAALADTAVALQRRCGATVYAQWEIAEAMAAAGASVVAIHPGRDARAEPVYFGTAAVVTRALVEAGSPGALGRVGVVAFADHLRRCVATARRQGVDAWAPDGVAMPAEYDALSGQPWCRSRLAYLLHDIAIGIAERRDALYANPDPIP